MSIAEKLQIIAENEQRVYDAGKSAGVDLFRNRVNKTLTSITAEDLAGVTTIAQNSLSYLPLTSVTLPDGLTSLGRNCFAYCDVLPAIVVPEGVTTIDYGVFNGCARLHDILLPSTVTSIGDYCFNCGQRSSVVIRIQATTPPTLQANAITDDRLLRIVVNDGCGDAYRNATNWAKFASRIFEEGEV